MDQVKNMSLADSLKNPGKDPGRTIQGNQYSIVNLLYEILTSPKKVGHKLNMIILFQGF